MVANKDNIITTEQLEKSEVTDYTANVEPTTGLISTENVEIFTPMDSGIDQESTDFTDNLIDNINAEATVYPQSTANTQQRTDHPENSTVAGFTIHLKNISTDSESASDPVKGLPTEPENTTCGKFTDDSVNTKVTTPANDLGGVKDGGHNDSTKIISAAQEITTTQATAADIKSPNLNLSTKNPTSPPNFNHSNNVDLSTIRSYDQASTTMEVYDFDTGTHGENTSGFSNLPGNTTLSDSFTHSSIDQTSYESNTLKDTKKTSERNSTSVSSDDENKTMMDELTTEAMINIGMITKETKKLLPESSIDSFVNETTTTIAHKITEMTKFTMQDGLMEASSERQSTQETATEQIGLTDIKASMLFVNTTQVSVTLDNEENISISTNYDKDLISKTTEPTVDSNSLITETTPHDEDGIPLTSSVNINETFSKNHFTNIPPDLH